MALQFIITNAGRAAMVNPAGGTKAVQIASVGVSPTAVAADPAITALPGEVKRITTIAGDAVATDMVHLIVRDESDATYSVRSFALYLADGTLFGIYGQAAVILEKSAGAVFLLAVDLALVNVPAANITFGATNFLNPPATTDRAGVVELATDAEAAALVDALRALTPKNMAAIFTAANILSRLLQVDGAGSGLDADLLDGQQGAWYTDIAGRLGYTPLNAASYTAGDVVAKLVTVDGAGSGVDADLLDGQHGAYYADIVGRLGYTPINPLPPVGSEQWYRNGRFRFTSLGNTGGQNGSFPGALVVSSDGAAASGATMTFHRYGTYAINMGLDSDGAFRIGGSSAPGGLFELDTAGGLRLAGSKAWTAGNDGAGSGLDADMVDGRHVGTYGDAIPTMIGNNEWGGQQVFDKTLQINMGGRIGGPLGGFEAYNTPPANGWYAGVSAYAPDGAAGYNFVELRFITTGVTAGERMRLTAGGSLGIGTTAPAAKLHVAGDAIFDGTLKVGGNAAWNAGNDGAGSGLDADMVDGRHVGTSGDSIPSLANGNSWSAQQNFGAGLRIGAGRVGRGAVDGLCFFSDDTGNERLRMSLDGTINVFGSRPATSGDVQGSGALRVIASSAGGYAITTSDTQNYTALQFTRQVNGQPVQIGSVTCNETSSFYNTSSDYRLKQDVEPLTGALDRLMQLPALRFAFKALPEQRVDGFLAHDLAAVIPEAVQGAKDAVNDKGEPIYQQIDQSKIVPLLVAAVQELAAEVAALKAAA